MLRYLGDHVWNVAALVVAAAALVPSWLRYLQGRRVRRISVRVAESPVLLTGTGIRGFLEVHFDGHAVQEPRLVQVAVTNDGNQAIRADDFDEPLTIRTGAGTTILRAQPIGVRPETLSPVLEVEGDKVRVVPMLLNARDTFTLTLLVSGGTASGPVRVTARAADTSVVNETSADRPAGRWRHATDVTAAVPLCLGALLLGIMLATWSSNPLGSTPAAIEKEQVEAQAREAVREAGGARLVALMNPTEVVPARLEKQFLPAGVGGVAISQVQAEALELRRRRMHWSYGSELLQWRLVSYRREPAAGSCRVTTEEQWYREIDVGPGRVPVSRMIGPITVTYHLKKAGGRWVVSQIEGAVPPLSGCN